MYEIPVAIFYACLFLFIIYRNRFFHIDGISNKWFTFGFFIKIIFGLGNFLVWLYIIGHGDSLNYFAQSKLIYNTLPGNPHQYLQFVFTFKNPNNPQDFPDALRYVSDFGFYSWYSIEYTMVRILAILNVFTFGSAFGNIIILCFVYFLGLVLLFKAVVRLYPENKTPLFILFFFFPSIVFWCSGLLKEGAALFLICLLLTQMLKFEKVKGKQAVVRYLYIIIILIFTYFIRDYLLLLLIPNLIIWLVTKEWKHFSKRIFTGITAIMLCIIIVTDLSFDSVNIPRQLQNIQNYFGIGVTEPDYYFRPGGANYGDLLSAIPDAINNILFRPNLIHSSSFFRMYQSFELIFTWAFILFCMIRINRSVKLSPAFFLLLFFSLGLLLLYGLVVMDADTLSRYRTIPVFFLLLIGIITTKKIPLLRNSLSA
ncbi:MAG: hypothetical protein H7Y00_14795 [Fimbriimonadaceae bacterium]|nr:hypothetical protein [Chitinophagales bacterium]